MIRAKRQHLPMMNILTTTPHEPPVFWHLQSNPMKRPWHSFFLEMLIPLMAHCGIICLCWRWLTVTFNVSIDLSNIHNNPINAHYAMTKPQQPFIFRGVGIIASLVLSIFWKKNDSMKYVNEFTLLPVVWDMNPVLPTVVKIWYFKWNLLDRVGNTA